MSPTEIVLEKLPNAKRNGTGWRVRCPAHDGKSADSLAITEGDDGAALLFCHGGCGTAEICNAIGIETRDLFVKDDRNHNRPAPKPKPKPNPPTIYKTAEDAIVNMERRLGKRSATWTYEDGHGEPMGCVVRWDLANGPKTYRPVSRVAGGWSCCGMETPRPLYGLPDLADADLVFVTEGEKAADAARSLGVVATTSPHGADGVGTADWQPLAGKDVLMLPDNDESGSKYLAKVIECLSKLKDPPSIMVVELPGLPDKGDAADWVAAGGTREQLDRLVAQAKQSEPEVGAVEPEEREAPKHGELKTPLDWATRFLSDNYSDCGGVTLRYYRGEFFDWNGAHYENISIDALRASVLRWLRDNGGKTTPRHAGDIVNALPADCEVSEKLLLPVMLNGHTRDGAEPIAFSNGLLHIEAAKPRLEGHTPNYFVTNSLPYRYDPSAAAPRWHKFLDETMQDSELIGVLQRYFGYLLTNDTSQQKLLLLVGMPNSGKGVVCRTLQRVNGAARCTSPILSTLAGNFGLWSLVDKSIAILPDAHIGQRADSRRVLEVLKSISGEDLLNVPRKNLPDLQNVRLATRFVITCNDLPDFQDTSGAIMRRLIVIPFIRSFAQSPDHTLDDQLAAESSGILNWAIEGLRKLRAEGRFAQPAASKTILANYARMTSPMRAFLEDCVVFSEAASVPCGDLYRAWTAWCDEEGHRPGGSDRFGEKLRAATTEIERTRPGTRDRRVYSYAGVDFSERGFALLQSATGSRPIE